MAIIDLPSTPAFDGMQFQIGVDTSRSRFVGAFTGNRQSVTHADRLRALLTLAPCKIADAGPREAFFFALQSRGDYLRMAPLHRKVNRGTVGGAPTVAADALAGATSIGLLGSLAIPNLLQSSSFEIDTNADGIADNWTGYSNGTTGTITYSRIATGAVHGTYKQRVAAATLGATTSDRAGVQQAAAAVAGQTYTLSCYLGNPTGSLSAGLMLRFADAGGTTITNPSTFAITPTGPMARYSFSAVAPALTATVTARVFTHSLSSGGASTLDFDAVQLEAGASMSAYAGYATLVGGDFLQVGNNLLMVGYAGATGNDAGAVTVPLALPLQTALTAGTAVIPAGFLGLWELDSDGVDFDYVKTIALGAVAVPLRQVIL